MVQMGDVLQTERFGRSFRRTTEGRDAIHRAFQRLSKIVSVDPAWQEHFKRVRGTELPVYELRVTAGDRLIFHWDSGPFTLVDVGPHEVVEEFCRLSPSQQKSVVARTEPADPAVVAVDGLDPLFLTEEGAPRRLYDEDDPTVWVRFLDGEQDDACSTIIENAMEAEDGPALIWLLGGAGTGKTSVLLNLLMDLGAYANCPVYWHAPESVTTFLRQTGYPGIGQRTRSIEQIPEGAVLLMDDPEGVWDVKAAMEAARKGSWRAVVIAFDPLQFPEKDSGEILQKRRDDHNPTEVMLRRCYRQSGVVARLAVETSRRVHTRSSYRTDRGRQEQEQAYLEPLIRLSLDELEVADGDGWTRTYDVARHENWSSEVRRLSEREDRWRSWPTLLVVVDDESGISLPADWRKELKAASISTRVKALSEVASFRGQEFQEAWLLMSDGLVEAIDSGSHGMPAAKWKYMRGLHTAVSRAKDGVVVFQGQPS